MVGSASLECREGFRVYDEDMIGASEDLTAFFAEEEDSEGAGELGPAT